MSDKQLQRDIENWAIDKLSVWFHDAVDRLKIIGQTDDHAEVAVIILMLSVVASDLATKTTVNPDDVGRHFAGMIRHIRERDKKRKAARGGH
jgi:hypothetical protein